MRLSGWQEMDNRRQELYGMVDFIRGRLGQPTAPTLRDFPGAGAGPGGAPKTYPQPTQQAIDRLKSDPAVRDQFEEYFGPGSADRALGR